MAKVLRKSEGAHVQLTDGRGHRMKAVITRLHKDEVHVRVLSCESTAPPVDRVLAMGVLRQKDRFEFAVEKAVELGATRLVFVHSEHTLERNLRVSRIDKTIESAVKQSQRFYKPSWEVSSSFEQVIDRFARSHHVLLADPSGEPAHKVHPGWSAALLLVGPEGGLSAHEARQAVNAGARRVALGAHRLRAETAVCAMLACMVPEPQTD